MMVVRTKATTSGDEETFMHYWQMEMRDIEAQTPRMMAVWASINENGSTDVRYF